MKPEDMQAYEDLLLDAARKKGLADEKDELRKIIFSEIVNHLSGDCPISKAEHSARASERYRNASAEAMNAKTAAHVAEAKAKGIAARFERWRTANATERAKMNLR